MPVETQLVRNRLLKGLPTELLEQIAPKLTMIELPQRLTLHLPQQAITTVHFVESGYVSMLAALEDGDVVEVGLAGSEGMIGLPLLFGTDRSLLECLVQSSGTALRMEAADFSAALDGLPGFRHRLLRYAMAFSMQVTMTAACNSRHLVEQRLARWLLMAHDRVEGDAFSMTHEFLSMMLGIRRAGISVAAGALQKAGLIRYEYGTIRIVDRPGLEAAACECHSVASQEFERLLDS